MIEPAPIALRSAWYLVQSKPRQEQIALLNLTRQSYEAYLPLLSTRRGVRRQQTVEPMFSRYLFVRLTAQKDNFAPIRSTVGVSRLVRFGDRYAVLPDELVTMLATRANTDGVIEQPERELVAGERVVILEGTLAGYEAIFSATVSKERIALLFQMAGRQQTIETARHTVQRVP